MFLTPAFLLFLVNFIAIEFAAASIFMLFGLVEFSKISNGSPIKAVIRHLGISFCILLLATTFMTRTLINIVGERKLDKEIRTVLTNQLHTYAGARLSDAKIDQGNNGLQVMAVVITPQEFDPTRVASMEKALQKDVDPNTQLIVRSVIFKDADAQQFLDSSKDFYNQLQGTDLDIYNNLLNEIIWYLDQELGGITIADLNFRRVDQALNVYVSVNTSRTVDPALAAKLQRHLQRNIDPNIKITVRSVVGGTATADAYAAQPD